MFAKSLFVLAWLGAVSVGIGAVSGALDPDESRTLDFSRAVILTPPNLGRLEQQAVTVLREEIQKRTAVSLEQATQWPTSERPVIAVGLQSQAGQFAGPFAAALERAAVPGPEGYALAVEHEPRTAAIVCGRDARGLLYGVGRLLRKMTLAPHVVRLPADVRISTAPKYPLRGQQLGYRPKTNAYDAWSPAQFDQYIRELALFGANSIEIVPPRTDDELMNRHMKVPPLEMMVRLSQIIDSYGLDVWVWYPNLGRGFAREEKIAAELAERDEVFRRVKRIDHLFVPGGDPGNVSPDELFPWLKRVATLLHKYHPRADIWVSPQGFEGQEHGPLASFYKHIDEKPRWLGGVVYGPWIPTTLPEMRARIDPSIKIRNYPDITHNLDCQYPVRNWDLAFALTLHRECYNPRPMAMKTIHNVFAKYTCGSLCYSEGINDDVNKFVWLDQDWDPATQAVDTLRDYGRLFISPDFTDELAQGFLAEEANWNGPLAVNPQVDVTLQQWRELENAASPAVRNNYRFAMGLLRAYYDACIKRRLIHETELEARALDTLRMESATGSLAAIEKAEAILRRAAAEPVAADYKQKCAALADLLFEKIGSQLTVKKHGAQHRTRGAFLDGIDEPLNNAAWLSAEFRRIRAIPEEASRREAIERILNRTNPGPGGFYDNLGTPASEHRIVYPVCWEDDPGALKSPRITFHYDVTRPGDRYVPLAWKKQACTLYETPLRLAYDHLDPDAAYSVRVVFNGDEDWNKLIRLVANGAYVVHGGINPHKHIQEFPIPRQATAQGHLELEWSHAAVAEVWLIRQAKATSTGK
jgi:hypothetical protein